MMFLVYLLRGRPNCVLVYVSVFDAENNKITVSSILTCVLLLLKRNEVCIFGKKSHFS